MCSGESGEGGKSSMKRARREKNRWKEYAYCLMAYILYVEVKCSMFSYSEGTSRLRSKFPKGFGRNATKIKYA